MAVIKSLGKYIKNVYKIEAEIQTQTLYKNSSKKNETIEFMKKNNFDIVEIIDNSPATAGYEERITFINNSFIDSVYQDTNVENIWEKNEYIIDNKDENEKPLLLSNNILEKQTKLEGSFVFIKVSKCGTETVKAFIKESVNDKNSILDYAYEDIFRYNNRQFKYSLNHINYDSYFTNHLNNIMIQPIKYIGFVRNPLDRLISHYYYRVDTIYCNSYSTKITFDEWYQKYYNLNVGWWGGCQNSINSLDVTNNFMSRYLGFNSIEEINEDNIKSRYHFIVVLEDPDKYTKLAKILNINDFNVKVINKNKSYNKDNIIISKKTKELFDENNKMDNKLYELVCKIYSPEIINSLDIKKNTNLIKDLYHYIPCHDQKGNDIYRVNKDNLQMTLLNASNDPSIIAINTEGYVKNHIEKLEQIPGWDWNLKTNESNGIYIKKPSNDTLIKCSKSSIPVLGTLVCTTTKWIEKQIQSIDFPIENYIIINNNENFLAKKLDILVSKGNKFIKNFKVYHMPYNLGCAEGWNTIIKSFLFSPYWVIVNDDVSFTPGFLKELHETAVENPDAGLIHGNPFTQHLLTRFGLFDMFLIRDWVIKDFGLFDTNFYPAYYEDYDYIFRLINSSFKIINQLKHKYYHGDTFEYFKSGQNTKKFSNKLSNKLTYIKSVNYNYCYKKWNIVPEWINENDINNIYKYPFNNPANKLSTISYDIEFARDKSLHDILPYNKKNTNVFEIKLAQDISLPCPNLIVIDNFYDDPDKIREYALSLNYQPPENHGAVGYRCESGRQIEDGTKELFEKLLHTTIPNGNNHGEWNYSTNGCFQWCNAKTPIVYHCDSQKYAAIIYLTPDAPPNCGTSFFRHKKYKIRNSEIFSKSDWYQSDLNYKEPHLDKTPWEVVDNIGNVYNRLVIFDAQYIHAVTEYFGQDINNSRLFQLFFFNIIN